MILQSNFQKNQMEKISKKGEIHFNICQNG